MKMKIGKKVLNNILNPMTLEILKFFFHVEDMFILYQMNSKE